MIPFDAQAVAQMAVERAASGEAEEPARPPEYSDDALALRFTALYRDRLRYVAAWGQWLIREPAVWRHDQTTHAFDLVRKVCRQAAAECENKRVASAIASARTMAAVEKLAKADRRHAATAEQWDADPWAFNTPGGVVDLRTGHVRDHRPDDGFTKIAAVAPGGDCPRWMDFLRQVASGDDEMVRYLQRFIGYSLTGIIREHAFAFLWGPGGNGKSVLLGTVARILGDYATTAMAEVFTVGRNDQHPTHLAKLRGARMVLVTEIEEGHPWAEARIKSLTGGDRISARVMRGDPFEFDPHFKLWIAGNHRPALRNPDPAMRRRLHLVPMTFVPPTPDPGLSDALWAEAPGILAWAIEGCLEWQRIGLAPPRAVADATTEYFADQDMLAEWLAERCEKVPNATMPSARAFADWKAWAMARGEEPGTGKRFSAAMERHLAKKKTKTGAVFIGARLRPSEGGVR